MMRALLVGAVLLTVSGAASSAHAQNATFDSEGERVAWTSVPAVLGAAGVGFGIYSFATDGACRTESDGMCTARIHRQDWENVWAATMIGLGVVNLALAVWMLLTTDVREAPRSPSALPDVALLRDGAVLTWRGTL